MKCNREDYKKVLFSIHKADLETIDAEADFEDASRTEILRLAVREYIARKKK